MVTNRRTVEKTEKEEDYYVTPSWAIHALMQVEKFEGIILEPCCGNGALSKVIKQYYPGKVKSRDLHNHGYGKTGRDFFAENKKYDNIITNPPFNVANKFILHALTRTNKKLCLLLRLAFLEGAARYNTIFKNNPPTTVWVFSERVTMYPGNYKNNKKTGGTTAYCWAIWDLSKNKKRSRIRFIKPGMKAQFSNPN